MVEQGALDYLRFCFMVAGHTKSTPDCLFAQVSNRHPRTDSLMSYGLRTRLRKDWREGRREGGRVGGLEKGEREEP